MVPVRHGRKPTPLAVSPARLDLFRQICSRYLVSSQLHLPRCRPGPRSPYQEMSNPFFDRPVLNSPYRVGDEVMKVFRAE
ncbi:MAG: hypothetical protein HW416_3961 [Chloroflexi bacterium]|nr:hypothetical protein [Chloroflexota bacterium]